MYRDFISYHFTWILISRVRFIIISGLFSVKNRSNMSLEFEKFWEVLVPGKNACETRSDFNKAAAIAKQEGLDYLCGIIEDAAHAVAHEKIDILWNIAREAPQTIAFRQDEFILQMIDEFQFMNAMIYWDRPKKNLAKNLAGGYLSTAESKIAPLLVSGSWVGWLMKELSSMLPARFRNIFIKNMPENEAEELLYKYSRFFDVPVTEETAFSLLGITEGNPFYISAVIRSNYPDKDLTSIDGLTDTLEFETLDDQEEGCQANCFSSWGRFGFFWI
jgi:hypothetical protein